MRKLLRPHEDRLGVTHGIFGSGLRFSNKRLADAFAEAQENENKAHSGRHWLEVSVPAGLVGIGIGGGFILWLSLTLRCGDRFRFVYGLLAGIGLGVGLTLIVQRIPKWCKHAWHVYRYGK